MKILITESKVNQIIRKYLESACYPDYNWGPELHDFYRKDVEKYGAYEFQINDEIAYAYYDTGTLEIYPWLSEKLTSLFGNRWEPVFIEWFEDNSGLKVDDIEKNENIYN